MNQEKFNLNKAKREAKKHEKKRVSLVSELKINKKEESQDFLEEELEAKYWRDLYKEKLDKIKDDDNFKNAAIDDLEYDIKKGKNGDGYNTNWVLLTISALKNLSLYKEEFKERLNKIKVGEDFKNADINYLEYRIKKGKNGGGKNASCALWVISALKNLSLYEREFKEKLNEIKNDDNFKKAAIKDLENDIKEGKNGDGYNATLAFQTISALKNLSLYKEEFKEKLNKIKVDEDFKKTAINDLENDIKKGKNGGGDNANQALYIISALKNISEFWQDLAQEKRAKMARDNKEGGDIPKRPEIR